MRGIVGAMTNEEVAKLAELARIAVPEHERAALAEEMDAILGYVSDVRALVEASQDISPVYDLENVMREDEVTNKQGEYTERIAAQFSAREGDLLRVPKIL